METPRGAATAWHQGVSVYGLGQSRLIGCLAKRPLHQKRGSHAVRGDPKATRRLLFASHLLLLSSKARDENWYASAGLLHKSSKHLSVSMDQNYIQPTLSNGNAIVSRDFEC